MSTRWTSMYKTINGVVRLKRALEKIYSICHKYVTGMSQLIDNYVKGKGERITKLGKRYYEEFLIMFWKKSVSNYVKIHEENVVARIASNDVAEILVLLNKLGESANITLRV
ncbi:hypothetical protein C1645_745540 [Glomus cerebriforme]|uniref:Uncharacterized protein n=1 Tax=Glomus cerebriforme TaxID=658196 RepID=A0A397S0Q3_9GLOM|nr:hypothetical protein C1645_745540 [Glomus cerebriforme]